MKIGDEPIGGSTGIDHESTASISEAALWFASIPPHQRPRPIVDMIRRRFGLTALEACMAIKEANQIEGRKR